MIQFRELETFSKKNEHGFLAEKIRQTELQKDTYRHSDGQKYGRPVREESPIDKQTDRETNCRTDKETNYRPLMIVKNV